MVDIDSEIATAQRFLESVQDEREIFEASLDSHRLYPAAIRVCHELEEAYAAFIRENGNPDWRDRVRELENVLQTIREKISSET